MSKTKVTLLVEENQKDFLDETGLNMSKLFREAVKSKIDELTDEEKETLKRVNG